MNLVERLFGAVTALIGVGVAYEGLRLGYISDGVPKSGFFPFWAGVLLFISGLAMAATAKVQPGEEETIEPGQLLAIAGTAAYLGLIVVIGAVAGTFAYLFAAIGLSRKHGIIASVLTAAISAAIVYFAFGAWLQVPLPRGALFGGG